MSPRLATAVRGLAMPLAVATLATASLSAWAGMAAARASGAAGEGVNAPIAVDEAGGEDLEVPNDEAEEEEFLELPAEPSSGAGAQGAGAGGGSTASAEGQVASASEAAVRLSSLRLERASASALAHHAVHASQIRFAFALSGPAKVRATLARASNSAGEVHWRDLPDSLTLTGAAGVNHAHLHGGRELARGEYRLALIAGRGAARSILIRIK